MKENNLLFIQDGTLILVRDKNIKTVNIPKSVITIGDDAFHDCSSLTTISIPDSVKSIGDNAFAGCTSLTTINIPNSVTSIGYLAFRDCSNLNTISIPDSVKSIGFGAFEGCSSLTSITIPNNVIRIGGYAYKNCTSLASIIIPEGVECIDWEAFSGCSSLTSIAIPNSVTSIGRSAFSGCSSLTSIAIPDSVTSIGSSAFQGCSNLQSITIPENLTIIENSVFSECKSLTNIIIPNNVTKIGDQVFKGCISLKSIVIGSKIADVGYGVIDYCNSLTSIIVASDNTRYDSRYDCNAIIETSNNKLILGCNKTIIPNSVTSIDGGAFHNCTDLREITIPSSVNSIGSSAFSGCTNLREITIPSSVNSIGAYAFSGCTSLASIIIPEGVECIEWETFSGCSNLSSITIPNSVVSIRTRAFINCFNLTTIIIPNSVTLIGWKAFEGCKGLTSISIPHSVVSIEPDAFKGCISFPIENNCRYADTYLLEVINKSLSDYQIKDGTRFIGNSAFENCSNLTKIAIPDSVISIGDDAFKGCESLIEVILPVNDCYIGRCAFSGCKSLSLKLSENVVYEVDLTSGFINESPFEGCKSVIRKLSSNGKEYDAIYEYHDSAGLRVDYDRERLTAGWDFDWKSEYEDWECSSYSIKNGTEIICDIAELGLKFDSHNELYMEMAVIHVPASVQYIGMYALSCYNLFLEGKDVNFAKYFLTEGTPRFRNGRNVKIFVPEHMKDEYSKRLEKAIPNINYSIFEISKENAVSYYQKQKQDIVKVISNNITIGEYTFGSIFGKTDRKIFYIKTAHFYYVFRKDLYEYEYENIMISLGMTLEKSCEIFGIHIERIDINKQTLKSLVGRYIAAPIYRKWKEDFSDEETGEIHEIEREEELLWPTKRIEDNDLTTILESGLSHICVFSDNTPINYMPCIKDYQSIRNRYNFEDEDWLQTVFFNKKSEEITNSVKFAMACIIAYAYKSVLDTGRLETSDVPLDVNPKDKEFSLDKDVEKLITLINDFYDQKTNDIQASESESEVISKMTVDRETYGQLRSFLIERNVSEQLIKTNVDQIMKCL